MLLLLSPGLMSKYLGDLKVGDSVAFKGPIPKYPYTANTKKEIGMIAGGEDSSSGTNVEPVVAGRGASTLFVQICWQLNLRLKAASSTVLPAVGD